MSNLFTEISFRSNHVSNEFLDYNSKKQENKNKKNIFYSVLHIKSAYYSRASAFTKNVITNILKSINSCECFMKWECLRDVYNRINLS